MTAQATRTILHVDMDAFYASVEVLLDPSLRGKPVIVGGEGARGVVASCSYEARAFGVRSAMASTEARRRCPQAVFVRGNHALYGEYSERIHAVFRTFTPMIEGIALDEAFLDVSGSRRLFGSGAVIAAAIRTAVFDATALWCCVGVGSSKLLAKLASKEAKPPIPGQRPRASAGLTRPSEGVAVVTEGEELAFLRPLPVRALWGVGPKTFERLRRFGVATVGDLAALPRSTLLSALGEAHGAHLHALAHAIDDRAVESDRAVKSIGHEETFATDHFDLEVLGLELLRMADAVASRTRHAGLLGRTVQLKIKTPDFKLITRSRTLRTPLRSARVLHDVTMALLREDDVAHLVATAGVRLIGVSLANLVPVDSAADLTEGTGDAAGAPPDALQLDLFADAPTPVADRAAVGTAADSADHEDDRLIEAVDAIRARFGTDAVGPASLSTPDGLRVKRVGDTQWGPNQ